MRLSKFQIIILLLIFWAYTQNAGSILPLPKPNYTPDLQDEDLEAKVLAAMIVIADDHKIKESITATIIPAKEIPQDQPKATIEEVEVEPPTQSDPKEVELFPGRYPRAIILTDTVNCGPCRDYERNTVNVFRTKTWQDNGWTIGSSSDNVIEIVDLPKEESKFYEYFDKLTALDKNISPSTPTTVFINMDGTVKDIKIGKIPHSDFVKLAKPEVAKASTLDTMSHNEMKKLHNELHGGGSWTWPGNLKTHLATHHGVK